MVPTHDKVLMVLLKIFAETELVMPATVAVVLVEDKVLMVLPLILAVVVDDTALLIPVTFPPVPVELKPVIVLVAILSAETVPLLPTSKPITFPCPVIFVMVFVETEPGLPKFV